MIRIPQNLYLAIMVFLMVPAPRLTADDAAQVARALRHAGQFESASRRLELAGDDDWACMVERAMLFFENGIGSRL